jgi:hypothetical protein
MTSDRPICVCKHHEMALYFWCKAKKEMHANAFFLVSIDKHEDMTGLPSDVKREISSLDLNDLNKIREFTMLERGVVDRSGNMQNRLTYDQFYAAMEMGLIQDMLLVTPEIPRKLTYEDLAGREHRIFHCRHPNNLRVLLKNQTLRQSIGYPEGKSSIILDIDLDFFTYLGDQEEAHVISEEGFKDIFGNDSPIWWIYEKARLATISQEPFWCGGIENSALIFHLLKKHLLNKTNLQR